MFGDPGTSGGSVFGGIITAPATSTPSTGTIFGGSGTATPGFILSAISPGKN
jgi:hypothetical protein